MNSFEYRIYYQWDGPSHSDPFVKEKTPTKILEALRTFSSEFRRRIADAEAQVRTSNVCEGENEVRLTIQTRAARAAVERALSETLKDWRLYGEPVEPVPLNAT